ncbi:MAG: hypothetical protein GXX78_16795 [Bacteroidales bacterium]|nr:hypothetical protein [Bacteroidales bacterium]
MDKYIQQLVEDLELAAHNPPKPSYIETPEGFEDFQSIVNLGLTPFKTIEQLTGIKQEAFPDLTYLEGRHWRALLDAIFVVFDSLKIKLIDAPIGIPKEWLYEAIRSNWNYPVQYLPDEGMDLELCVGDNDSCPYGIFCSCDIEWPDDEEYFELEMKIPEKYLPMLPKIAEAIDAGWVCIMYNDTLELKTLSQDDFYTPKDTDALFSFLNRGDDNIFELSERFIFEPLLRYEHENMMEEFASRVRGEPLRKNLFDAFDTINPIERFTTIVLQSDEKNNWLAFRQEWLEDHIKAIIWQEIKAVNYLSEINGIYNDDGTRVDKESIPTPSLCMLCKSFYTEDAEENILCLLNRNDQRNETEFKCGAFEKI